MIRRALLATVAVAATITAFGASSAKAQVTGPVTPTATFGSQPSLNFGGIGIPNDFVETNTTANQAALGGVLLALTATQRYSSPVVTNDGAGTFFAGPGTYTPSSGYALWNFDFAITGAGVADYSYRLWYDFNPVAGNVGDYGYLDIVPVPNQNSWNLAMGFLSPPSAIPGLIFPPPPPRSFNPNTRGEYGFALIAYSEGLHEMGRAAILVNTFEPGGSPEVVPEPASMTLLATGLVGMAGAAARRRKRSTKA